MIGERFIGRAEAGGEVLFKVPVGADYVGVRAASEQRVRVELLRSDGRLAAFAVCDVAADDPEFPGSGYSLMVPHDGAGCDMRVRVDVPAELFGAP
jgi:hypothetical protein